MYSHKKEMLFAMQYWLTTYYTRVYTAYYLLTILQSDQKSKKMFKLVAVYAFGSFIILEIKDQVKHIVMLAYFTFYQILSSGYFMHTEKDIHSMLACNSEHSHTLFIFCY